MRRFLALLALAVCSVRAADPPVRPGLIYSKPFGGSIGDIGTAIAVDAAGNVYVAGNAQSLDFPAKNALQSRLNWTPLRATVDGGKTWLTPAIPDPVLAVAGSPKAPGVLYAGARGGAYKSTDAGKTWNALKLPRQMQINAIAVDPANASTVYAAGSQILVSHDAGATWTVAWDGSATNDTATSLIVDTARPSTLFAVLNATFNGVYLFFAVGAPPPTLMRSTDSGATWKVVSNTPAVFFALVCDPSNADILYAAALTFYPPNSNSVYKSTDGGITWTPLKAAPSLPVTRAPLAATPQFLYAATANGVLRSGDGGTTWSPSGLTAPCTHVAVDPANSQSIYASAGAVFSSSDAGVTWTTFLPIRQNVQSLSIVSGAPAQVFVGAAAGQNVFVTKWSADGKQMIYSTYLGGSYYDYPTGIAVDRLGNAYVTGYTYSTDFPVTTGALQSRNNATYSAFLAKIAPDGATLAASTYLGGSKGDAAFAIALDASGNSYLTGFSSSPDLPVTPGAFQSSIRENCPAKGSLTQNPGNAFASKISPDLGTLLYSTLLGGGCGTEGIGIKVDSTGNAYIAGATTSTDFPVTKGALQQTATGPFTGFLAKLTPQGSGLAFATYIGDPGGTANDVALDSKGNLYITGCMPGSGGGGFGQVGSPNLPLPGIPANCFGSAYLRKLDPAATSEISLTPLGASHGSGVNLSLDPAGNIWVAGLYVPVDPFSAPLALVHPFQAKMGQGFVSQISPDGGTILFSSRMDSANAMALDASGNAFLTGWTDFPDSSPPAFAAFVARIDRSVPAPVTIEEPQRLPPGEPLRQDNGVAPGQIVTIDGSGLGPTQEVTAQIGADGKLASTLAGTSVLFDGILAPLLSVRSDRVACLVPFAGSSGRTRTVQVRSAAGASNSIRLAATASAIEVFAAVNQDGSVNSSGHPAAPGSILVIYAAGFGQTDPPSVDGQINTTSAALPIFAPIQVDIGGQRADILYAGPAPGEVAGIMQINVRIPQLDPSDYDASVGMHPFAGGDEDRFTVSVGR